MQQAAIPIVSELAVAQARRLLLILISLSMLMSISAVLFKLATVGAGGIVTGAVRIVIEGLLWTWLWSGSNAARIIWFVLYVLGLLIGMFLVCMGVVAVLSSTPQTFARDCMLAVFFILYAVLAGFGTYILQTPGTREFLRLKREQGG